MNNGVEPVIENSITGEPIETNNSEEQDWYQSLLFSVSQMPKRQSSRTNRIYNVIRRKDGVTAIETNVSTIRANKIRTQYRKQGFAVDLIEVSTLTGEIHRGNDPVGKIPSPVPYETNSQRSRKLAHSNKMASFRANRLSLQNAKLNVKRDQHKSLVYDKESGLLVFSGNVDDAIDYIIKRMEDGIWQLQDWVIYLPAKIWIKYCGSANG